ncbi:MAG: hypothetical protein AUK44_03580 [Porphyromonadaceae bacterium CG2_30_38_12]|nr:MAG: hypothetical protein AUK44_03580 [Porphyromonadaceae bacterium CG2_30_38_12]
MKKFFYTITLLCFSAISNAQYTDYPIRNIAIQSIHFDQLKFGIKLSPLISWVDASHNNLKVGGAAFKAGAGITAQYELNDFLSVISSINYNSIGGYVADSRSFGNVDYKDYFKLNYGIVEVPLGLRLKTPRINKYNYYLQGGVNTGFVLSANEQFLDAKTNKVIREIDILKDLTYPSTAGFFAGIGSSYALTEKLKLFGEINFKRMLTTISNGENYRTDTEHVYTEALLVYPSSMEFSIGVEF